VKDNTEGWESARALWAPIDGSSQSAGHGGWVTSSLLNLTQTYREAEQTARQDETTRLRVGSTEHVPVMTGAGRDEEHRSEVVFLPTVTCPVCASNSVVVEIEVEETPILSCTACGHTSQQAD
jgi:hypothetical protein